MSCLATSRERHEQGRLPCANATRAPFFLPAGTQITRYEFQPQGSGGETSFEDGRVSGTKSHAITSSEPPESGRVDTNLNISNDIKPITAAYKPSPKAKERDCNPPPHIKRSSATRAHDQCWHLPAKARASIGSGGQPARCKSDRCLGNILQIG